MPLLAFLVLVAGMMISPIAVEWVWAEETTASENDAWEYREDGDNIIITKYTGSETEITVPAIIDGKKVIGIL